ncbi:hypothetical protein HPB47_016570 [Ixodes persulcatus]|uniref:Uncharacterized protein n=1 Tax=Ixodes persulcatus TaxID=34615 RepID=A0AC60QU58_IXOPE|nr:hypothetical protein HPB47_016570 [Ixodes persulcatus]
MGCYCEYMLTASGILKMFQIVTGAGIVFLLGEGHMDSQFRLSMRLDALVLFIISIMFLFNSILILVCVLVAQLVARGNGRGLVVNKPRGPGVLFAVRRKCELGGWLSHAVAWHAMNPDLEAALPPTSTEGNTCISYGNPLPSRGGGLHRTKDPCDSGQRICNGAATVRRNRAWVYDTFGLPTFRPSVGSQLAFESGGRQNMEMV